LAAQKGDLCRPAEQGSQAVSLAQAIATLERALNLAAGVDALTRLAQTKVGRDPAQAEAMAAAEIGKANPGGALAALLLAYKQQPAESRHLENAGVVAVSVGYPQEALALFAQAERLPVTLDPEMGIDRTATMLNNRAYALIRLGRYSDAIPLLRTAIGREPLLNEAQRNLAVALTCLGQFSQAGTALRAGQRRSQLHDLGDPDKAQSYDPTQVFDLSHGQPVKLPDISYPNTLEEAAGAAAKFQSEWHSREDLSKQLLAERDSAPPIARHSPLTIIRIFNIEGLAGDLRGTPEVARLYDAGQVSYKAAVDADKSWFDASASQAASCMASGGDFTKCEETWCTSNLPEGHREWLAAIKKSDADLRAWANAYSRFATGLASNLADPGAHQWVLADTQYQLMVAYALQIDEASVWIEAVAGLKGTCYDQITDAPAETKDGGKAAAITCSGAVGGANFSLDLELFTITVSCEEIGIEAEAPELEGGLAEAGNFASVSYKFKRGSTTLFVGAYAKTREIGGLSSSAHGGAYLTWDNQGNVTDVGVRGEASIDQSEGQGSSSLAGHDGHWSFVGAADGEEE
jgi:tetratricopeptide (TPR) repeat protein